MAGKSNTALVFIEPFEMYYDECDRLRLAAFDEMASFILGRPSRFEPQNDGERLAMKSLRKQMERAAEMRDSRRMSGARGGEAKQHLADAGESRQMVANGGECRDGMANGGECKQKVAPVPVPVPAPSPVPVPAPAPMPVPPNTLSALPGIEVAGNDEKPTKLEYSQGFEDFWSVYPRKVGKGAAWKAWQKVRSQLPAKQELLAIVVKQSHQPSWQRDGGQFIPHPSTWLNERRWLDGVAGEASAEVVAVQAKVKPRPTQVSFSLRGEFQPLDEDMKNYSDEQFEAFRKEVEKIGGCFL